MLETGAEAGCDVAEALAVTVIGVDSANGGCRAAVPLSGWERGDRTGVSERREGGRERVEVAPC